MLVALTVATQLVKALRSPIAAVLRHDRSLGDQLRRAATSIVLNIAEGAQRVGRDRLHSYRIAAGSAAEVQAALVVADALGYIAEPDLAEAHALVDRELGLLWGLTHARS